LLLGPGAARSIQEDQENSFMDGTSTSSASPTQDGPPPAWFDGYAAGREVGRAEGYELGCRAGLAAGLAQQRRVA
jgi:hypothetical protein